MGRSILSRCRLAAAIIVLAASAAIAGCSGTTSSPSSGEPGQIGPNEIATLEFSPSLIAVRKGDTKALKVTAVMGDGTKKDVTNEIQYISDNPRTATVDKHGTIVGAGLGITTVRVNYKDASGSVKVTVTP